MRWLSMALLLILVAPISAQAQTRPCTNAVAFKHAAPTGPIEIVAGKSNERVYYCGFVLVERGTTLDFIMLTGTGTNCGTNTINLLSLELPSDVALVNRVESVGPASEIGHSLCLQTSGTGKLSGIIYWAQF
jgi:hypothetical protein